MAIVCACVTVVGNGGIKYRLCYSYLNVINNGKNNFLFARIHGRYKHLCIDRQVFKDSRCIQNVSRDRWLAAVSLPQVPTSTYVRSTYLPPRIHAECCAMQKKRNLLSTGHFTRPFRYILQLIKKIRADRQFC